MPCLTRRRCASTRASLAAAVSTVGLRLSSDSYAWFSSLRCCAVDISARLPRVARQRSSPLVRASRRAAHAHASSTRVYAIVCGAVHSRPVIGRAASERVREDRLRRWARLRVVRRLLAECADPHPRKEGECGGDHREDGTAVHPHKASVPASPVTQFALTDHDLDRRRPLHTRWRAS
jgi:hypothetical protein